MIALRVRSVTIVVRSGIFLVNALVSRTVFATSKFLYRCASEINYLVESRITSLLLC